MFKHDPKISALYFGNARSLTRFFKISLFIKTEVFELAAARSKPRDVALLELSGLDQDSGRSKFFGVGVLEIDMSVPDKYDSKVDWILG